MKPIIGLCISVLIWFSSRYIISFALGFAIGFISPIQSDNIFVLAGYASDIIAIIPSFLVYRTLVGKTR